MDLKIKIPINDIDNETQSNILELSSKKQNKKRKKNQLQIIRHQILVKKSK